MNKTFGISFYLNNETLFFYFFPMNIKQKKNHENHMFFYFFPFPTAKKTFPWSKTWLRHEAIKLAEARLEHRDPGTRQAVDWRGGFGWKTPGFGKWLKDNYNLLQMIWRYLDSFFFELVSDIDVLESDWNIRILTWRISVFFCLTCWKVQVKFLCKMIKHKDKNFGRHYLIIRLLVRWKLNHNQSICHQKAVDIEASLFVADLSLSTFTTAAAET